MNNRAPFLIFAGLLAALTGCRGQYTDVSNDSNYRQYDSLIGKEFKTKVPLYVFKLASTEPEIDIANSRDIGIPGIEKVTQFPYKPGPQEVYGILPAGSTYRITKAIRDNSSTMGGVDWRAVITSSGPFQTWAIRTNDVVGQNFKSENVEEAAPGK